MPLNVVEVNKLGENQFGGYVPAIPAASLAVQNIVVGATSNRSAQFHNDTYLVRLTSPEGCWYKVGGSTVEASASDSIYLPASTVEPISVRPGQYIACIQL